MKMNIKDYDNHEDGYFTDVYGIHREWISKYKMTDVESWLKSVSCYDTQIITVRLGKCWYRGVEYYQDRSPLAGAKSQENYTVHGLYLLGIMPHKFHAYYDAGNYRPFSNIKGQWYVGSYYQGSIKPEHKQFNSFGINFSLFPYESKFAPSGKRITMSVVYPGTTLRHLLSNKYTYVTESQDLEAIIGYFGLTKYAEDITGAIVEINNGEYINAYFTESSQPYNLSSFYAHVTHYL